jgi:UDPglucose--hexose-1-phosphate uridylyltransferase
LPDLRKDPITGRWVIISTDRARRPQDFLRERPQQKDGRTCPFCAGREDQTPAEVLSYRSSGGPNQPGWSLRVVPNKYPALRVEGALERQGDGIYDRMSGIGAHEVIIETPEHTARLEDLNAPAVASLFFAFRDRALDLRRDGRLKYAVMFKNHGEAAGASLEHTHSQLIALPVAPKRVLEEMEGAARYFGFRERCVYCDIVQYELQDHKRLILETEFFVVIAPYAPRFPFETWVIPRQHHSHFEATPEAALHNLGWVMRTLLQKIGKALEEPPYNMIIHTAPLQDAPCEHYHWHIELMPKLTRVAGFERGTGFYINPTPPEEAAQFLRDIQAS